MNRNKLKTYAIQAREDFIAAVETRAAVYGLSEKESKPVKVEGDTAIIGNRAFPKSVAAQRKRLDDRIGADRKHFHRVMEGIAYTWFNRLAAIRFMELHGYFDHGFRVLSARSTTDHTNDTDSKKPVSPSVTSVSSVVPEILRHAEDLDLPGLKREKVVELKLAGNKDEELYRLVLIAQCNALHAAMPFLFEKVDDETELLLPDNLLHSDSLIRKLVGEIDEADWREVEIIGWLYQFYISKRKDEVIGKVVASEDIPAATQLFTPNWIVKYLVQNTLGRQWLATCPDSSLRQKMEYYIEPAEQTPEVQEQLKAITPASLNPEEITFLDPACGSGHILVEAYDVFKAIYQERGYRARDIPRMILTKNLFGLEIDDRAAQLAAFALMMKAREDDRRIFEHHVQPNVRSFIETAGMDAEDIAAALNVTDTKEAAPEGQLFETEDTLFTRAATTQARKPYISLTDVQALVDLFEHARTFGSLIQVPPALAERLPLIDQRCREVAGQTHEIASGTAARFLPVVKQARMLASQYDCVVANPPYMGAKYYNALLKHFVNTTYTTSKADLCVSFIERGLGFTLRTGLMGQITMQSWMFLSSFERFRSRLIRNHTLHCMAHLGPQAFPNIGGHVVQVTAFVAHSLVIRDYRGSFRRLIDGQAHEKEERFGTTKTYIVSTEEFSKIPSSPIAYTMTSKTFNCFANGTLGDWIPVKEGLNTGDNERFLRLWYEVSDSNTNKTSTSREEAVASRAKWFPCNKGSGFRKWYGNNDYLINWENDGQAIRSYAGSDGKLLSAIRNTDYYFRPGITWSGLGTCELSARAFGAGFVFNSVGRCLFPSSHKDVVLGFLNSKLAGFFYRLMTTSIHFSVGDISRLPLLPETLGDLQTLVSENTERLVNDARLDWNLFETSWEFQSLPVLQTKHAKLDQAQEFVDAEIFNRARLSKELEEDNNRLFIEAYGLQDELSPEVPDDQITLYRPNREEDIKRLISYAVGCMMGRYSLDEPGLIYANSGNIGFDPARYQSFPADQDGIVPVTEVPWFADDATNRFAEFVGVAWPRETLEENLTFVAESLGPGKGEAPRDTIRRYLATGFFKHHLQTYKRRPIYWLFSSGKQRAFQCLVYLHRYHEGTLSRMRTEYVIPLQGMIAARIEHLAGDIAAATSTAQRKKLEKERETLLKQQVELHAFDEKLRHLADQRITLDLDDGVKVNYGKFGDLLAEVKAVTGGQDED